MVFALVGISVVLVIVITIVLMWAVRSGQFEDMEGPAWRVIMDDDRPRAADDAEQVAQTGAQIEAHEAPPANAPEEAASDDGHSTAQPNARSHE